MTRRYNQETDDITVKRLFQCVMSDEQIAARLDVSPAAIAHARNRIGLGRPKGRPPTVEREEEELPPLRSTDLTAPMAVAFLTFGDRLKEVNGAYRLDGTPMKFFELMKETNRVRANRGLAQVGHDSWRVP